MAPFVSPFRFLIRAALALAIVLLLSGAAWLGLHAVPEAHVLRISGGPILSNRHLLVRKMQAEAAVHGIRLEVVPTAGSLQTLDMVEERTLDLGLAAGQLDIRQEGIVQLSAMPAEVMHLLAGPGIATLEDLRGRTIQTGAKGQETRGFAQQILAFAGFSVGRDYVEMSHSDETLVELPAEQRPDGIFILSFMPSPVVDRLVREQGYRVLPLPYGPALALRERWAVPERIAAHTYAAIPAVPQEDINTVGVSLMLVAGRDVPEVAAYRVLEMLYGPRFAAAGIGMDERRVALPSGLQLSDATNRFVRRHSASGVLWGASPQMVALAGAGAMLALAGGLALVLWHAGGTTLPAWCREASAVMAELRRLDDDTAGMDAAGREEALERLAALRQRVLAIPPGPDTGPMLFALMLAIRETRHGLQPGTRRHQAGWRAWLRRTD